MEDHELLYAEMNANERLPVRRYYACLAPLRCALSHNHTTFSQNTIAAVAMINSPSMASPIRTKKANLNSVASIATLMVGLIEMRAHR